MTTSLVHKVALAGLAALASAAIGATAISLLYWSPRHDAAVTASKEAQKWAEVYEGSARECAAKVADQNAGVAHLSAVLQDAIDAADDARKSALAERVNYELAARNVLQEQTPEGQDACAAAAAAFDAELRLERLR